MVEWVLLPLLLLLDPGDFKTAELVRLGSPTDNASAKRITRRQQRKYFKKFIASDSSQPVIKPVGTIPLATSPDISNAQSLVLANDVSLDTNVRGNNSLNSKQKYQ